MEDLKARGLKCKIILDVGANEGRWSRLASSVFSEAQFILIEPLREMKDKLDSICRKHPGSRWYMAGAGREAGKLTLTVMGHNKLLSGSTFIPPESSLNLNLKASKEL